MKDPKWILGVIGALLGFVVAQAISYYIFEENLRNSKESEQIRLSYSLAYDFFYKDPLNREIRMEIEACEHLYKSWGGNFDHDQLNKYLSFFADLGYFYQEELLELKLINHFFGDFVIEAYEHPEVRRYVDAIQQSTVETALAKFLYLGDSLEMEFPNRHQMGKRVRSACASKLSVDK